MLNIFIWGVEFSLVLCWCLVDIHVAVILKAVCSSIIVLFSFWGHVRLLGCVLNYFSRWLTCLKSASRSFGIWMYLFNCLWRLLSVRALTILLSILVFFPSPVDLYLNYLSSFSNLLDLLEFLSSPLEVIVGLLLTSAWGRLDIVLNNCSMYCWALCARM